jgi:hypothetical protein
MVLVLLLIACGGCEPELEREYGYTAGRSINGTSGLRRLFESAGARVRVANRLDRKVFEAADVLVRFQVAPGVFEHELWGALQEYLEEKPGRRAIYVPCAFDAEAEYWEAVEEQLSETERERRGSLVKSLRERAQRSARVPALRADSSRVVRRGFGLRKPKDAGEDYWIFGGPWSRDVDLTGLRLPREAVLELEDEEYEWQVLLKCRGEAIVAETEFVGGSKLLLVPNGSFLLNEPLVRAERRKLAERVVQWALEGGGQRVVFVEGAQPTSEPAESDSLGGMGFLLRDPFRWMAAQFLAVGLAYILFHAARLGRARPLPAAEGERPVRHAEALGDLLARSPDRRSVLAELETYRRRKVEPAVQRPRQPRHRS